MNIDQGLGSNRIYLSNDEYLKMLQFTFQKKIFSFERYTVYFAFWLCIRFSLIGKLKGEWVVMSPILKAAVPVGDVRKNTYL